MSRTPMSERTVTFTLERRFRRDRIEERVQRFVERLESLGCCDVIIGDGNWMVDADPADDRCDGDDEADAAADPDDA